jgi:Zn-dependent M16 (insulinase) family peptidase
MDRKSAEVILKQFGTETHKYFDSHAYAVGYMESVILSMLEGLKPADCMAVLAQFEKTTREYRQNNLLKTIKEAA